MVTEFISLDGVIEDPGGAEGTPSGGWAMRVPDPDAMRYKLEEIMAHDAMLLGRVTYEGFAAVWPTISDDTGFAERMNSIRKYVVSSTLGAPTWANTTVIRTDAIDAIAALAAEPGGDLLVVGSATLARELMAADLVDEYRLMVFPVVLGEGKRLFTEPPASPTLILVDVQRTEPGTLILTYYPDRGAPAS